MYSQKGPKFKPKNSCCWFSLVSNLLLNSNNRLRSVCHACMSFKHVKCFDFEGFSLLADACLHFGQSGTRKHVGSCSSGFLVVLRRLNDEAFSDEESFSIECIHLKFTTLQNDWHFILHFDAHFVRQNRCTRSTVLSKQILSGIFIFGFFITPIENIGALFFWNVELLLAADRQMQLNYLISA